MKVDWIALAGDGASQACLAALQALGLHVEPGAGVRVLVLADDEDAGLLQGDDTPTLLLAATDAQEAAAQRAARAQDDVARLSDAPAGLMQRLARLVQRAQERDAARAAVERDALTGALNRRFFTERAEARLEAMAPEAVAGFFVLDVDQFKRVNDHYGHEVGDRMLAAIAACLGRVEAAAPLCRLGGDEFCWMAEQPSPAALGELAAHLLQAVRELDVAVDGGSTIGVTASVGWTRLTRGMSLQEAMHEADNAMYDAKAKGRDRVQSWAALNDQADTAGADVQLLHFQNVARVVNERATSLVTLFGKGLVEKAQLQADQDRLTRLWNRGYFDRRLAREMELSARDGRPLTLVMMDLDHFGQFNRQHGLPTGDAVLRHFAAVATGCIRPVDWLARYGGEEFALVLPGTLDEAAVVAERIREAVEAVEIDAPVPAGAPRKTVRVTVSIGVATLVAGTAGLVGPVGLIQRASDALQRAKREGRNRVAA